MSMFEGTPTHPPPTKTKWSVNCDLLKTVSGKLKVDSSRLRAFGGNPKDLKWEACDLAWDPRKPQKKAKPLEVTRGWRTWALPTNFSGPEKKKKRRKRRRRKKTSQAQLASSFKGYKRSGAWITWSRLPWHIVTWPLC